MGKASREKGKRGERRAAEILSIFWPGARREAGQCRKGSDAPDVNGTPFWVEAKEAVVPNAWRALEQALVAREAGKDPRVPLLILHRTRGPIEARGIVAFRVEDLARVCFLFAEAANRAITSAIETRAPDDQPPAEPAF
jgi:hypothetical protein